MAPVLLAGPATGGTATLTIPSTTAGSCLVAVIDQHGTVSSAVTGVTLGGAAGNFGVLLSQTAGTLGSFGSVALDIWADPSCAGGQTAIAVAGADAIGFIAVYEFSGLAATSAALLDQKASAPGTAGTYSSGTTATTANASQAWVGGLAAMDWWDTEPSSPWACTASSVSHNDFSAYQITTSTGTAVITGSYSASTQWAAGVVCLNTPPSGVPAVLAIAAGAAQTALTSPHSELAGPYYPADAADLGGGSGAWATPQFAEGGP